MSETNIVPLRAGGKIAGIIPTDIEEVWRIAGALAKSGMAPRGMDKQEQIVIAIMHGLEVGLPPMMAVQKISVINGRPTIWGDAVPALLLAKGFKLREDIEVGPSGMCAVCTVVRPDGEAITRMFSEADAKTAGLWGKPGPWKQYPQRMLAMRARAFASRDGAADALSGLYVSEEMQDVVDITPRKSSAQAKRDGTDQVFNQIVGDIQSAETIDDLDNVIERNRDTIDSLPSRWHDLIEAEHGARMQDLRASAAE